jgi:hypothetical protein
MQKGLVEWLKQYSPYLASKAEGPKFNSQDGQKKMFQHVIIEKVRG